jgi:osmotically-inducible protein OsmY
VIVRNTVIAAGAALTLLSRFAKNATEKSTAESIARKVNSVKSVMNGIAIRL